MTNKSTYVELASLTMSPCDLTDEAYTHARQTWRCNGCCAPKPRVMPVEARLVRVPGDPPLNFVNGCLLALAYRPFLDRFPSDTVKRDLFIGPVYGPNGKLLHDWVTFRGRRRVIIRGNEHVTHRMCPECGRDLYFAMGNKYLYPEPPGDAVLFESDGCGIVLRLDVFERLDLGKWRKMSIDRLMVLDAPKDDLGELAY